jgi:phosphoribosylformimino-5-aminoimidazole carboxamide ribotide isomerase
MLVIPAVDMKDRKAVRLKQGKADQQTVYDEDPVHAARRWVELGARRMHVVDLDGAFGGTPKNLDLTLAIIKAVAEMKGTSCEIQIGGGLRSAEVVTQFMAAGVTRCVIGTKALEDRDFLRNLASRYPGRISVGLDAKDGQLVTKGWVEKSATLATDLVSTLYELPLGEVIYTDIDRDGMLKGPNLKRLKDMRDACTFPLIASGGITTLDHIKRCRELGCYGAIIGTAFYDGRLEMAAAQQAAGDCPTGSGSI